MLSFIWAIWVLSYFGDEGYAMEMNFVLANRPWFNCLVVLKRSEVVLQRHKDASTSSWQKYYTCDKQVKEEKKIRRSPNFPSLKVDWEKGACSLLHKKIHVFQSKTGIFESKEYMYKFLMREVCTYFPR